APILELEGISKTYGPVKALTDVHFAVYPGTIHAILGENGAGKSTLMKLISGAISPSAGTIRMSGGTVKFSNTADASARGIVSMFQELSLMPPLRVSDNIILAKRQSKFGIVSRSAYRQARAALDRIGSQKIRRDTPVQELNLA